jgi:hypothetical protein
MPRNISFMLTTSQVRDRTKTVTRRNGWRFLKVGDVLCAVEKSQGLSKGGKVKRICMIRVVDVRQEPLRRMTDDLDYGFAECLREGFPPPHPNSEPSEFVSFFCNSHRGVTPEKPVTRIEFEYLDEAAHG